MRRLVLHFAFIWVATIGANASPVSSSRAPEPNGNALLEELEALLQIPSVVGRETHAADFILQRLGPLSAESDALGNVTLSLGSGAPKRLIAVPLDEPGYVVSRIQDDGYLRLTTVGRGHRGRLWHQFREGQKILVSTEKGLVPGAITVVSSHLGRFRRDTNEPFNINQAYVDIGAESAAEVEQLGIEILDPVTLIKRPSVLKNGMIAAPSSQMKAASTAMVHAARRLAASKLDGSVVFAWTVLGTLNRKGLESVVMRHGPFDEAYLLSRNFGFSRKDGSLVPAPIPQPGSGVMAAQPVAEGLAGTVKAPHVAPSPGATTGGPDWKGAEIGYLGIPARYLDTPVEMVHIEDVRTLSDTIVRAAGGDVGTKVVAPEIPSVSGRRIEPGRGHERVAAALSPLISTYGVSGFETRVRERVRSILPSWAEPEGDETGNLFLTVGEGEEHIVFVAHMDELGFVVETILEDGCLKLKRRGGFYPSLWEGQAASIHTLSEDVPGVFEPRRGWHDAEERTPTDTITVYLGTSSRAETEALGIEAGSTTVTMPKEMWRIGEHRAVARSFDDRAGCAALILALVRIDPSALTKRVTFAWSTEEEVGMTGAKALAERFQDATRVYPVDTFVSSEAPGEWDGAAYNPLGEGAVIRVLESISFVPRKAVKEILDLANASRIAVQVGTTSGGTDGQPFLSYGIVSVPLSWPGRYSHSPVEVLDFRDIESLVDLIEAIALN